MENLVLIVKALEPLILLGLGAWLGWTFRSTTYIVVEGVKKGLEEGPAFKKSDEGHQNNLEKDTI